MSAMDDLHLERAWLVECSRCSNEASSFALEMFEARHEFAGMGWTAEDDGHQFCPRCSQ